MGLAYGVVVAGIEAKSHFLPGSSNSEVANKPIVRPADSHLESKASHAHSQTAAKVHHNNKAALKTADLVENKTKLKSVVAKPALKAKVKAHVKAKVAKDAAAVNTKIHKKDQKKDHKAQDPAKPHLRKVPKALALGEQLEIKKVEQKALAQVKREVEAATAAQKQKQESSLDGMLNVPEADFEQSSASSSSSTVEDDSSNTVDDILKMEKELLEDEVMHPNDGGGKDKAPADDVN